VAVDLPGCGGTAAPATWERATITELALDVAELIRAEELDVPVIVGHSLGAGIGLQLALNEPDLLSGLVLFAPVSTRGIDFAPAGAVESLAKPTLDDQLRLLAAAFHRPPEPATMSSLESVIRRASPIHIESAARSMHSFDVEASLASITTRTLLLAGDRDRHVPIRNHIATWTHLKRAGLHVEHNVGHVPFVEATATSVALVNHFLDRECRD